MKFAPDVRVFKLKYCFHDPIGSEPVCVSSTFFQTDGSTRASVFGGTAVRYVVLIACGDEVQGNVKTENLVEGERSGSNRTVHFRVNAKAWHHA